MKLLPYAQPFIVQFGSFPIFFDVDRFGQDFLIGMSGCDGWRYRAYFITSRMRRTGVKGHGRFGHGQ